MRSRARQPDPQGRAVLVTGASTGLGQAAALHLARLGFQVFAGVRKIADGERLVAESAGRLRAVTLDITDTGQIRQAVTEVAELLGPGGSLWGLVNNAGISIPGPLECVPPHQVRLQYDTNVVGSLEVTQAFLPMLRRSRGRIVNVTSGLGRVALPFLGAYAAAQFAKEGLSDALRRELKPFGVAVTVVQPGSIATPIWAKLSESGHDTMAATVPDVAALYRASFLRFLTLNERQARRSKTSVDDFATVVARVLTTARPRTRYTVGPDVRLGALASRLLPDAALDRYLAPLAQDPTPEGGS